MQFDDDDGNEEQPMNNPAPCSKALEGKVSTPQEQCARLAERLALSLDGIAMDVVFADKDVLAEALARLIRIRSQVESLTKLLDGKASCKKNEYRYIGGDA